MIETHGLDNLPELPSFAFKRTSATVVIEPCADGELWHYTWNPDKPPETVKVQTPYMELGPEGPQPHFEEQPWEPVVQHVGTEQLLNALTPEEAHLFMGWCSHVHEQLGAHLEELADAVKLAVQEKRWDGVASIAEDLHVSCCIRTNVEAAGRTAFDLTDV